MVPGMVDIVRIRTNLTGTAVVGGGVSDFYFGGDSVADPQAAVDAVAAAWDVFTVQTKGWVASWDTAQAVIDAATGIQQLFTTVTPPANVAAAGAGDMVANATQALVKYQTAGVVAGRSVRGKTFIPGQQVNNIVNGKVSAGFMARGPDFVDALMAAAPDAVFGIYSRPFTPGVGDTRPPRSGSFHEVIGGTLWSQFAVLRSRRD
uniref:Uncharacterized protein n=1 Tax=uncultured prokaryote TaxID=198431 RepID=A0A0H5Q7F8_9ZZZZ|nr:hypothetical protein [uncultured prokaryote]